MTRCLILLVFFHLGTLSWGQDFFVRALGAFRMEQGVAVPVFGEKLAFSSQQRADRLALNGFLSHEDEKGRGPGLQLLSEGFAPGEFGEVLGAGSDAKQVWDAWLVSPAHRAVLLNPDWTMWGWGKAVIGKTVVFVLRFRGP